jgi:PleD family two-component response regulator
MENKDNGKHLKIIVVDDSEMARKRVVQQLEEAHFTVIGEAANAQQVMEILGKQMADLIIIDLVMPEVSGIDLAKHIKDHFREISIIMMSSLSMEHIIIDAIGAGASDFLVKPILKEDLILSVQKIQEQHFQENENPVENNTGGLP